MEIVLLVLGLLCVIIGILGSFLPVLPGPPISWLGLLLLYLTPSVPDNWWFLVITAVIALAITALDYWFPVIGTKKFGGSRAGMIGTTIGLVVAIFFPVLGIFGIVIWPFIGALVGELTNNSNREGAVKAAFGSFLGFLTGTFLKFVVAIVYFGFFVQIAWRYREGLFAFELFSSSGF